MELHITLSGIFVPGTKDEVKSPRNWDWNSAKELLKYVSCIYIYIYMLYVIYIYIHFTMMYYSEVYPNTCCWFLIFHPWEAPDFASAGPSGRGSPSIQLLSWDPPLSSLYTGDSDGSQTVCYHVGPQWETPWQIYIYIYICTICVYR